MIDFSDEGVRPADHDALVSLFEAAKAEQGPGTGTGRPRVASMFIASYHSSSGGSYPAADSGACVTSQGPFHANTFSDR